VKGAILVAGTTSDAGKTVVVTALCRWLADRGISVAPFKGQNMSLNSYVDRYNREMSRAQAAQAMAARVEPRAEMNPILLKPTGERTSQLIVLGKPTGTVTARSYQGRKADLVDVVDDCLSELRREFDVVILEGAGSPAEINLAGVDLVNAGLATRHRIPIVLVADIDRGGVFASLVGTYELLPPGARALLAGYLVNKFRGDPSLLDPGFASLADRTGMKNFGVLAHLGTGLIGLDAEDSLALASGSWAGLAGGNESDGRVGRAGLAGGKESDGRVGRAGLAGGKESDGRVGWASQLEAVLVAVPALSNFTDFDALALDDRVRVRTISTVEELGQPDLILLPGSRTTVAGLRWFQRTGLAEAIHQVANRPGGPVVFGICAGFQMMGRYIDDPIESQAGLVEALGWLEVTTTFRQDKIVRQTEGWAAGQPVRAYEIHHGRLKRALGTEQPGFIQLAAGSSDDPEEVISAATPAFLSGRAGEFPALAGTTWHGIFDSDDFRTWMLEMVAARRDKPIRSGHRFSFSAARQARFDQLARWLDANADLVALAELLEETPRESLR
jgi:adenosylcobyric acid synthase